MLYTKLFSSLIPVYHDKEPIGNEISSITMCRNQPYSFQLAFKWEDEETHSKDLIVRIKSEIPISFYYANNVPVLHTSWVPNATPAGLYPDILLPKKVNPKLYKASYPWLALTTEKDEDTLIHAYDDSWQAMWFCVNEYSKTIKSGTYDIEFEIYDRADNLLKTVTLSAEIIPAMLPKQKLLYTNWFHNDCLADLYGVEIFSDRYFEIMADYVEKAARNGMNMILLPAFTPPLDTSVGDERMTTQLVKVTKNGEKYDFDFSLMKRFIDICRKCGITHFEHCHLFTQWGAEFAPKVMVWENGKEKKLFGWHTKATGKKYVSFLRQYITALKPFLKEEKLDKNIMFHISDEPSDKMYETYSAARNSIIDLLDGYMVGDALSHIELYEKGCCDMPIPATSYIQDFIGKCDNLWAYYTGEQCTEMMSNRHYHISRERNRMLGIQLYYHNIKGFLHWAYNFYYGQQSKYNSNPLFNPIGGFGASHMVYPNFDGTCYQSIRQKIFAEGIYDIRLLSLLEKLAGREACDKLIIKHFGIPTFTNGPANPAVFEEFEKDIYAQIKAAVK